MTSDQNPPSGTFVYYSAELGKCALEVLSVDDDHPNSVFTRALLPALASPGKSMVDIARHVRTEVQRLTGSTGFDQRPIYHDGLSEDFHFMPTGN